MSPPRVSVVVATRNRARRLDMLLQSLRKQTLEPSALELVVVDDGSTDATSRVLALHARTAPFSLETVRLERARGPAAARNEGWRRASAELIAFTDDDCVATPGWLQSGLAAHDEDPGAVIQGRVEINPDELDRMSPFAHFFFHYGPGGGYPTANIFYPRVLLESLGGFDSVNFAGVAGEDTDLAARALATGVRFRWAPEALVRHGVLKVGAIQRLRVAARWTPVVRVYKLHPELRRELRFRLFWRENHWLLTRLLVALLLPRRFGPVRLALAAPYLRYLTERRTGPVLAPYLLAIDAIEMAAIIRGAVRYRTLLV